MMRHGYEPMHWCTDRRRPNPLATIKGLDPPPGRGREKGKGKGRREGMKEGKGRRGREEQGREKG